MKTRPLLSLILTLGLCASAADAQAPQAPTSVPADSATTPPPTGAPATPEGKTDTTAPAKVKKHVKKKHAKKHHRKHHRKHLKKRHGEHMKKHLKTMAGEKPGDKQVPDTSKDSPPQ